MISTGKIMWGQPPSAVQSRAARTPRIMNAMQMLERLHDREGHDVQSCHRRKVKETASAVEVCCVLL